jgi:uncharacterized protein YjeT (DUF2065 family)
MKKKTKKLMSPKEAWLWRQMVGMADSFRKWLFVFGVVFIVVGIGIFYTVRLVIGAIKEARDGGWRRKWR